MNNSSINFKDLDLAISTSCIRKIEDKKTIGKTEPIDNKNIDKTILDVYFSSSLPKIRDIYNQSIIVSNEYITIVGISIKYEIVNPFCLYINCPILGEQYIILDRKGQLKTLSIENNTYETYNSSRFYSNTSDLDRHIHAIKNYKFLKTNNNHFFENYKNLLLLFNKNTVTIVKNKNSEYELKVNNSLLEIENYNPYTIFMDDCYDNILDMFIILDTNNNSYIQLCCCLDSNLEIEKKYKVTIEKSKNLIDK